MLRRRREGGQAPAPDAALAKRIAAIETHEISPWVEQCLYTIGSSVTAYGRDPVRAELLEEALNASRVCTELLEEFRRRVGL